MAKSSTKFSDDIPVFKQSVLNILYSFFLYNPFMGGSASSVPVHIFSEISCFSHICSNHQVVASYSPTRLVFVAHLALACNNDALIIAITGKKR